MQPWSLMTISWISSHATGQFLGDERSMLCPYMIVHVYRCFLTKRLLCFPNYHQTKNLQGDLSRDFWFSMFALPCKGFPWSLCMGETLPILQVIEKLQGNLPGGLMVIAKFWWPRKIWFQHLLLLWRTWKNRTAGFQWVFEICPVHQKSFLWCIQIHHCHWGCHDVAPQRVAF